MNNNRFYVYIHRRNDTNEVFYIGKGCGRRKTSLHSRSSIWKDIVKEANGFKVEILKENLSNDESKKIESIFIINPPPDWKLVNVEKPSIVKIIDKSYIEQYLYYDETSPSCLRWKIKISKKIIKDSVAGYLNPSYYPRWRVKVNGKLLSVHRIVAVIHGLDISKYSIDHIDGNPSNNNINNLRCVTDAQNSRNLKKNSRNTSGVTGVSFSSIKNRWSAQWVDMNGKIKSKHFSCNHYDYNTAFNLACDFRKLAIQHMNEQGAGYTNR